MFFKGLFDDKEAVVRWMSKRKLNRVNHRSTRTGNESGFPDEIVFDGAIRVHVKGHLYQKLPRHLRNLHRQYAEMCGDGWIPCPICGESFALHEISIVNVAPDPTKDYKPATLDTDWQWYYDGRVIPKHSQCVCTKPECVLLSKKRSEEGKQAWIQAHPQPVS